MLNTDRGADNYMIKYCTGDHGKTLVDVAPTRTSKLELPMMSEVRRSSNASSIPHMEPGPSNYSRAGTPNSLSPYTRQPHIHIAAIDNSLSFPHEHPKGWRSYTYGWLYLPVTIIGRPFSQKTREHFLPLLTSKTWWSDTTYLLRKLFAVDPDFHPKMFNVCLSSHVMVTRFHVSMTAATSGHERPSLEHRTITEAWREYQYIYIPSSR